MPEYTLRSLELLALLNHRRGTGDIVFSRALVQYRLDFPRTFKSDAERLMHALGIYRHTYEETQRGFSVHAIVGGRDDSLDVRVFYEPLRKSR